MLDHHVSSDDLGAEFFKNTSAEATGRLVVEAADALGVPLTPEIAAPAFAALATDTGWFRFSSDDGRNVAPGRPPGRSRRQARSALQAALRARQPRPLAAHRADARPHPHGAGRPVDPHLDRAARFRRPRGALPSDTEDIINMTLTVGGTEMAVIFVEQSSGQFKVSFRSRSDVDCSKLAEQFRRRRPQESRRRNRRRSAGNRSEQRAGGGEGGDEGRCRQRYGLNADS